MLFGFLILQTDILCIDDFSSCDFWHCDHCICSEAIKLN